jgi:hypothetical protein
MTVSTISVAGKGVLDASVILGSVRGQSYLIMPMINSDDRLP